MIIYCVNKYLGLQNIIVIIIIIIISKHKTLSSIFVI